MRRCAKIVATIGPASQDALTIQHLVEAGIDVARLNFSHGTHENHARVIALVREAAKQAGRPITILQDLQGPKIRTGNLVGSQTELKPGEALTLTTKPMLGNSQIVSVDFPELLESVSPGGRILLDDGNLELSVTKVNTDTVETRVVQGGILKPHKGVNLPGAKLNIPSFTEKDREDLAFGLEQQVDVVAMSFVRSPNDITIVRQAMAQLAPGRSYPPIIAKLERPEALDNLEEIVNIADGVMVARGDLGVEMSPEAVPIAQKRIIECANQYGKIVITATQMLDSMIHHPRPTRAEASDVANAIFDGTDAVMLSGETATGEFPVQSVRMMDSIVKQAEDHMSEWGHWAEIALGDKTKSDTFFITIAARDLARDKNVAAIAVFTKSGQTALMMSKRRSSVPVLAFTPELPTYQRIGMYWGIQPHLVPHANTIKAMLHEVEMAMIASSPVQSGQQVVVICGFPVDTERPANMALLHTVGSLN